MTDYEELREDYAVRFERYLEPMALALEDYVKEQILDYPRIDRIVGRAKGLERFLEKAFAQVEGEPKYLDPLNDIQDQIGVRIITNYVSDLPHLREKILEYFSAAEEQMIIPDDASQFGYEGLHYILFIPDDIRDPNTPKDECPEFFELQIKTLFQHAWAEANHDLAYKSEMALAHDDKRKVAFTAAQAWGADQIFDQLVSALRNPNGP